MSLLPPSDAPGDKMFKLAAEIFPICRSITGNGVRRTLDIVRRELPETDVVEVPTGTKCFDWTVPDEWNIREAYIIDPSGRKIVDFTDNNLHVVSYSEAVDREISREELEGHLHSRSDLPSHIPYVTSYYKRTWGFCLPHELRTRMGPGTYRVKIDATLAPGHLTYGELRLRGETDNEVLLSTYICHPSMANNEASGPAVTIALAQWLAAKKPRKLSYRILFLPETIGSIVYLSRHLPELKQRLVAGYIVTCVGDDRTYSLLPSRDGNTRADAVARHVLKHTAPNYRTYSFAYDRGSDERQYCAPGVDLPIATLARSLYAQYPEYHTSADDLRLISPAGLAGSYTALQRCLSILDHDCYPKTNVLCEPHLGPRGLYPEVGGPSIFGLSHWDVQNVIAYADGRRSLLEIAEHLNRPAWILHAALERAVASGVVSVASVPAGAR